MCLTVFDRVLVGWVLQHRELNCQQCKVTTKRGRMFQYFLLEAKKTNQTNKQKKTEIKNPAEDERKGLVYRTQKPIYTSGQL